MVPILIVLFMFGAVFGSFFYVVGSRLPKNESILKPGSHCEYCNHELKWYELIPIISYLIQFGKCRKCKKHITFTYCLIEIVTGLLFVIAYMLYGISYEFFAALILFSLLILIFVSDFKYMIILDSPLVIASILILGLKWCYFGFKTFGLSLISGILIFGLMFLILKIGNWVFKKESLGGGDVKLSFVIGVVLGFKLSLAALILSSFLAFPYAFAVVYLGNKKELPFGPFLAAALTIVFLFTDKFADLIYYLFPGI